VSEGDTRERLLRELWGRDRRYYELAREHVLEAAGASREYEFLRRHLPATGTILEVGCGEGSNMEALAAPGRRFVGCDLSTLAAQLATGAAPADGSRRFVVGDGERLPFAPGAFPAVLGVSLLEHLPEPERVIEEMLRVLVPGGRLLLLSPQYGAPLGASPCRRGGGAGRFLRRLLRAHLPGGEAGRLGWERVRPLVLDGVEYDGDRDTVVEPELTRYSWNEQAASASQRAARALLERLGRAGLPPYRHFGPLLAVAATKEEEERP